MAMKSRMSVTGIEPVTFRLPGPIVWKRHIIKLSGGPTAPADVAVFSMR